MVLLKLGKPDPVLHFAVAPDKSLVQLARILDFVVTEFEFDVREPSRLLESGGVINVGRERTSAQTVGKAA